MWGTSGDDTITIGRNPNNSGQIRVQMNAQNVDFASQYVKLVKVEGRAGNDLIQSEISNGAINAPMLSSAQGNDTLMTSTADDRLFGEGDADLLIARNGNNYVNGGAGNDRLYVGTGNDTLVGEGGSDYFSSAGGNNTFTDVTASETVVTAPAAGDDRGGDGDGRRDDGGCSVCTVRHRSRRRFRHRRRRRFRRPRRFRHRHRHRLRRRRL